MPGRRCADSVVADTLLSDSVEVTPFDAKTERLHDTKTETPVVTKT